MTATAIGVTSLRAAALSYAARGWPVLPLHWWDGAACSCGQGDCLSPGKHPYAPLVPRGFHDASAIANVVDSWWKREPRCNVGVRTGPESGLLVIDADVRDTKDGWRTMAELTPALGPLPDTVQAITGSGSAHLLFQCPAHAVHKSLGEGVDVKAAGGYIVVAPSSHQSGRAYAWDANAHPDDMPIATLPKAWADRLRFAATAPARPAALTPLPVDEVAKIRSALGVLSAGDYDFWIKVGMALHHASGGSDQGMGLWYEWSTAHLGENPQSDKGKLSEIRSRWLGKGRTGFGQSAAAADPVTLATVFAAAHARGWVAPLPTAPPAVDLSAFGRAAVVPNASTWDDAWALQAPGALGMIVQWSLSTAPSPVPLYALAAALSLGSVLAGRTYELDGGTYSPLYVLVSGRTGSGKEWVKRTITDTLMAVAPHLIGPGDFSSEGAVLSALRDRPQLVAVLDEFGQQLAASKGPGSHHRAGALRVFMEAWGSAGGALLGKAMSSLSLKKGDTPPEPVRIYRPSLTLAALTTPDRLHSALESGHVADGMLNRWLLLEHDAPRAVPEARPSTPVPPHVEAWARLVLTPRRLGGLGSGVVPVAHTVPMTAGAALALRQAAIDATAASNALDERERGAGGLWVRAAEMVRRLTLIAAVADSPEDPTATESDVAWARAIVWWSTDRLVTMARDQIGETPFERVRAKVLSAVQAAGEQGVTRRVLMRGACRSLDTRAMDALMTTLVNAGQLVTATGSRDNQIVYFQAPSELSHDSS